VRTQAKSVDELFACGDELTDTQAEVLGGRQDAAALREAAEHERAAVDKLTDLARGLLTADGQELSSTVIDRVADTLHAAALDGDARAAVSEGTLVRELRHVGLGGGVFAAPSPAKSKRGAKPTPAPAAAPKRQPAPRADPKTADRARTESRRAARIAEADARREADRAARALKIAQERHERAAQALEEAQQSLDEATREARAADDAHARARKELDAL
jgi:hypothetical protein